MYRSTIIISGPLTLQVNHYWRHQETKVEIAMQGSGLSGIHSASERRTSNSFLLAETGGRTIFHVELGLFA